MNSRLSQSPDPFFLGRVLAASLQSLRSTLAPDPASKELSHSLEWDLLLPTPQLQGLPCVSFQPKNQFPVPGPQSKRAEVPGILPLLLPKSAVPLSFSLISLFQCQPRVHTILPSLEPGGADGLLASICCTVDHSPPYCPIKVALLGQPGKVLGPWVPLRRCRTDQ